MCRQHSKHGGDAADHGGDAAEASGDKTDLFERWLLEGWGDRDATYRFSQSEVARLEL